MNESKSQLTPMTKPFILGCYKYQNINERKQITTKNIAANGGACCYKYQNINERKQITTSIVLWVTSPKLLQISEYQ